MKTTYVHVIYCLYSEPCDNNYTVFCWSLAHSHWQVYLNIMQNQPFFIIWTKANCNARTSFLFFQIPNKKGLCHCPIKSPIPKVGCEMNSPDKTKYIRIYMNDLGPLLASEPPSFSSLDPIWEWNHASTIWTHIVDLSRTMSIKS